MTNHSHEDAAVAQNESPSQKLSFSTKLAYGAGDMGAGITSTLLAFSLLIFLTNVAGLKPELAGTVLLIGKIWDAINDPIVGVLSDRTRSRWGRRHSWMIFAAIPFGIFFFLQWIVPHFSDNGETNQWILFWYYAIVSILFNMAFTGVNLPYTALTAELTQDYNERTSLNNFRFAFSIGGSIFSLALGQIIFATISNDQQRYLVLALICTLFSVLPTYWCVWGTQDPTAVGGSRYVEIEENHQNSESEEESIPFFEQFLIAFTNKPFLYVIGIYLFSWLAFQLTAAIIPYFLICWMRQDSYFTAALVVQGVALVMLFVWNFMSRRVGKRGVYFMGMSLWIIAEGGLFFLPPDQVGFMYVLFAMAGFGVATAYLVPWSMLPDVIELDELKTGKRREGIFYAFMVLLQKFGLAFGLWLVGVALGKAGLITPKPGESIVPVQPESALFAIRFAVGPLPTFFLICGLILAYFYPITREVHAEILLKLRERKLGLEKKEISDE
ncbi:MAG TPA: MFS transporter [Cyanobacteria bacterium UBA11149]|nr:MFS transporter [Cyanobacteria bacterium UBA11367]HBE57726.1 MFS transporter [Cyanobacteria bacterium UBA11366]HBK66024.1 MFS transporter [Cyanobacteria bacterium UBA11166]HBR75803.1 MFS transporter [Cyanobacteria bacterium UBA11159]HBS72333.1 MFS transporter [Cyanobacteria bacterium UBA11153]HBW91167.1 MFS transporter [Cyanobacteria bacterium UBA11149]HCA94370.1 MFS transporter [Cyanobacteria bacterium UBA9226]